MKITPFQGSSPGDRAIEAAGEPERLLSRPGPLDGVRVLDLTRLLPGAYCTQMLADFGAEVIKIEQPGNGDYWRWSAPKVKTQSAQFLALNRGKKSITLDLKSPDGREAFLRLCTSADIVIEGFRPGVMARLGLDHDTLLATNPKLVVCALTGFGQDGPWAQLAAHDLNYVGMTGLLHLVNGRTDNPSATALPVGDVGAGALMALSGILAALFDVRQTGKGRFVDVSVADGLLSWVGFIAAKWNVRGNEDVDIPFDAPFNKPFYSVFETKDGRHLVTGAYEERFWKTLCEVLHLGDWVDRQWAEGEEEEALRSSMAAAFRQKTLAEWMDVFSRNEACVTPVNTLQEALNSEHARARGTMITIDDPVEGRLSHVGTPIRFDGHAYNALEPAPPLGAHSDELLAEIGYTLDDVRRMRAQGSI